MKYEIVTRRLTGGKWIGMYYFDGHTCAVPDNTRKPVQGTDGGWLVPTPFFESEEEAKAAVANYIKEKTGEEYV